MQEIFSKILFKIHQRRASRNGMELKARLSHLKQKIINEHFLQFCSFNMSNTIYNFVFHIITRQENNY